MGLVLGCGISDEITLVILRELQQHLEILLSAWWISNGWGLHGHSLLWQQPGQSLQHHHASELDASIWYHCSSQHGRQLGIIFVPVGLVHNHALHRSHFHEYWTVLLCIICHCLSEIAKAALCCCILHGTGYGFCIPLELVQNDGMEFGM